MKDGRFLSIMHSDIFPQESICLLSAFVSDPIVVSLSKRYSIRPSDHHGKDHGNIFSGRRKDQIGYETSVKKYTCRSIYPTTEKCQGDLFFIFFFRISAFLHLFEGTEQIQHSKIKKLCDFKTKIKHLKLIVYLDEIVHN